MSQRTSSVSSPRQPSSGPIPLPTGQHIKTASVSDDAIAKRAYEKFMARGCVHGFDREDWAGAEEELNAEALGKKSSGLHKHEAEGTRKLK